MKYFRSNKPLFMLLAVLLFLCSSCLGLVAGDVFFSKTSSIPEWRYLGAPPEKIDRLLATDFDTIYVRTIDKNIYACRWSSPYDINCWIKAEKLPDVVEDTCRYPQAAPPSLPSGNAVEILQFHRCSTFAGSDSDAAFNYYLLNDGTVVQQGYDEFHLGWPPGVTKKWSTNVLIGLVIGVCFGIFLTLFAYFMIFQQTKNEALQP